MNWDRYYHNICEAVATKSSCLSRQIGAILVRDKSVVATGFNGPPRGIPHCDTLARLENIDTMIQVMSDGERKESLNLLMSMKGFDSHRCPRKNLGFKSGEGLEFCIAAHAERNCLINAARLGVSTLGTSLYLNTVMPCKDCMIELINAGIVEIVCDVLEEYNDTKFLLRYSKIKVCTFDFGE